MQQTKKYKLDLIEPSDAFSPDALNVNTQKVEDVLSQNLEPLDARVTVLEGHKFAFGSWSGGAKPGHKISVGFKPNAVIFITNAPVMNYTILFAVRTEDGDHANLALTSDGFELVGGASGNFNFIAIA